MLAFRVPIFWNLNCFSQTVTPAFSWCIPPVRPCHVPLFLRSFPSFLYPTDRIRWKMNSSPIVDALQRAAIAWATDFNHSFPVYPSMNIVNAAASSTGLDDILTRPAVQIANTEPFISASSVSVNSKSRRQQVLSDSGIFIIVKWMIKDAQ